MKLVPISLAVAAIILSLSMVLAFPFVAYVAHVRSGAAGVRSSGIAGAICWTSATTALFITSAMRNSPHAVSGMLVASMVRFGVPLAAGLTLSRSSPQGLPGIFGYVVAFYLLALIVETTLSVMLLAPRDQGTDNRTVTNG